MAFDQAIDQNNSHETASATAPIKIADRKLARGWPALGSAAPCRAGRPIWGAHGLMDSPGSASGYLPHFSGKLFELLTGLGIPAFGREFLASFGEHQVFFFFGHYGKPRSWRGGALVRCAAC